jgi:hypothetical protein
MRHLGISIFLIFQLTANAQLCMKGEVMAESAKKPVANCIVKLKNSSIGIITNNEGLFELHVPESSAQDTLVISCLGFELFQKPVSAIILQKTCIITLKEKPYLLKEVKIGPPLDAPEIIAKVNANLKTNYSISPSCSEGFFREYEKANGQYDKLMEGCIVTKLNGFNLKKARWNENEIHLTEVRSSLNTSAVREIGKANNIAFIIDNAGDKIFLFLNDKHNKYAIDETEYRGDDLIVTLKCEKTNTKKASKTTLTYKINTSTWAIEEFRISTSILREIERQLMQSDTDSMKMRNVSNNYMFRFTEAGSKYYLGYAKFFCNKRLYGPHSIIEFDLNTEYVTSNVMPVDCRCDSLCLLNKKESLYRQIKERPYHEAFWKNCNIILDNTELQQVRRSIDTRGDIDQQFHQRLPAQPPGVKLF